jgi:hypothetical protein
MSRKLPKRGTKQWDRLVATADGSRYSDPVVPARYPNPSPKAEKLSGELFMAMIVSFLGLLGNLGRVKNEIYV